MNCAPSWFYLQEYVLKIWVAFERT